MTVKVIANNEKGKCFNITISSILVSDIYSDRLVIVTCQFIITGTISEPPHLTYTNIGHNR